MLTHVCISFSLPFLLTLSPIRASSSVPRCCIALHRASRRCGHLSGSLGGGYGTWWSGNQRDSEFPLRHTSFLPLLHFISFHVRSTCFPLVPLLKVLERALAKQSLKVEYCPKESTGSSAASRDAGGHGGSEVPPTSSKESVSMSRSLFASLAGRSTANASSSSASGANKDMDRGVNAAFVAVCAVLRSQIHFAAEHLPHLDARLVASALCLRAYGSVAAHVKRLKVSPVGGVWLARDLDELLHCAEDALTAAFPSSSSPLGGEGFSAGSAATAAPMPSLARQASNSSIVSSSNKGSGGGASDSRVVLGAMAALRDATAVLVVPSTALPKVVEQLAEATAASAARAAEFPLSADEHTGGLEEVSGSSNGGGSSSESGGPESVARLFLLELLKCRADYKDSFGRRAVWVKDMFPDIDGAENH